MDKDLNVRPETVKFFEENIGRTLSDKNHSKILYHPPPSIKTKINKWDIIKLKSFCTMKEQGEKATFRIGKNKGNKTTDKELISKIYKKLMQPNTRKQTTQSKSRQKT